MAITANNIPALFIVLSFSLKTKTPIIVPNKMTPTFTDEKTVDG